MSDTVDVAIIGAGPYGLALAAHLKSAGVDYRQFGMPMRLWESTMPNGMFLKSQGFASNISDPDGTHTLEAFCKATSHPYASYGLPVPLENFVNYGHWFQADRGLAVEETMVTEVTARGDQFELTVGGIDRLLARRVVVAIGVEAFAHVPEALRGLPSELCTHASGHRDLSGFNGQDVIVIGAGQYALETAALLNETGASVQLLARKGAVVWNGTPLPAQRPLLQRLREPESGLGSGWATWFYSNRPDLFRQLPAKTRVYRARTALGPAGSSWLRPRVEGQFPVLTGHTVTAATEQGGRARLTVSRAGQSGREFEVDHVIASTGYRTDLSRLLFLPEVLRNRVQTLAGSPAVSRDYQSSVPGLYFIGPAVAQSMGPVMRFVFGTWHAAPVVARKLAGASGGRVQPAVAASR
jgi:thioredoxin reductase